MPFQSTIRDISLPRIVLSVAAADPPCLVPTPQGHFTGWVCVPCAIPLACQIWPPNRHCSVVRHPASFRATLRAASVMGTPTSTGSLVWWMALQAHPQMLLVTAFGHLAGRGIAGMPLLEKPVVIGHGTADTEATTPPPAVADWAAFVFFPTRQISGCSFPLMVPAAFVDAAWAAQPDRLIPSICGIGRQLAKILNWVPLALDEAVVGVCQRFLPLVVEAYACNTQVTKNLDWHAKVQGRGSDFINLASD